MKSRVAWPATPEPARPPAPTLHKTGRPKARTAEAAAYIGSTKSTMEKWRMLGIGPRYSKIGAGTIVYDYDLLDAFVEERSRSSTSEVLPADRPLQPTTGEASSPRRAPRKPRTSVAAAE
jgi:hypothetical protein